MGNTTTYHRPAACKSSLKQSCITVGSGSFGDGLLRFHYLNGVSGTGGLELAFIGGRTAGDGVKYGTALQNAAATLWLQKQRLLCGDGNRNPHGRKRAVLRQSSRFNGPISFCCNRVKY